jgi:hypothetical protein
VREIGAAEYFSIVFEWQRKNIVQYSFFANSNPIEKYSAAPISLTNISPLINCCIQLSSI